MDFKYKFKLFYIKLSREKLVFERRHDQILESGVQTAVEALGQNPGSTVLINNYNRMKKALMDSKIKRVKEKIFERYAKYLMKGEKPVKSFFDKFKNKRENKPTVSLINEEGEEVFDAKSMLKVTEDFYKKTF